MSGVRSYTRVLARSTLSNTCGEKLFISYVIFPKLCKEFLRECFQEMVMECYSDRNCSNPYTGHHIFYMASSFAKEKKASCHRSALSTYAISKLLALALLIVNGGSQKTYAGASIEGC